PGTNSSFIDAKKGSRPGQVTAGQTCALPSSVTNTGNITLTNVTVTNAITALGASRRLLGPISLAPGAGTTFSDSYVVPLDSCGRSEERRVGEGSETRLGRIESSKDSVNCPGR